MHFKPKLSFHPNEAISQSSLQFVQSLYNLSFISVAAGLKVIFAKNKKRVFSFDKSA